MSIAIETALAIAAKRTNTSPTKSQKATDSYAKGRVEIHGLPVNIENPKGSERSGIDNGGKRWSVKMPAHYGEVRGTEGKDGDPVDVYIGPDHASKSVFVVDQVDARTGKFDEHKAMLSYGSKADALADYRKAFSDGKANDRIGAVTIMTVADFRDWLKSGNTKKPLADSSKSGRDTHMARDTKSTADAALAVARRFATGGAVRGYADGGMADFDSFVPEPPISDGDDGVKASIAAYRPELAIGQPSKPSMPIAPLPPLAQTEYVYVTKHPKGHKQHRALDGKFRSDPKVEIARRAGGAVTRISFDASSALGKAREGAETAKKSAMDTAKKYATGGSVHVGPVMGATGGRADELPISVPSGSFVVPADVVSSLGSGNTAAGMDHLQKQFAHSGTGRANGGAVPVPIKISDGEFVISPEDVATIGGGDMAKGHKTLDAMMVKLRKDHIKTLAALPPPSK